jgi:hypothetical protein
VPLTCRLGREPRPKADVLAAGDADQGVEPLAELRENGVILVEADQVDFKSGLT